MTVSRVQLVNLCNAINAFSEIHHTELFQLQFAECDANKSSQPTNFVVYSGKLVLNTIEKTSLFRP